MTVTKTAADVEREVQKIDQKLEAGANPSGPAKWVSRVSEDRLQKIAVSYDGTDGRELSLSRRDPQTQALVDAEAAKLGLPEKLAMSAGFGLVGYRLANMTPQKYGANYQFTFNEGPISQRHKESNAFAKELQRLTGFEDVTSRRGVITFKQPEGDLKQALDAIHSLSQQRGIQ